MGREYKIKFAVPVDYEPVSLFRRLPSPIDAKTMVKVYDYAIERDGFYFVDHLVNRGVAAVALQKFLDEALGLADSVEVIEP